MALRPLVPKPPKEELREGWDLLATEAGRAGQGLRVTVMTLNGEPKDCQTLLIGNKAACQAYAADVAALAGVEPAVVLAALPKLAYAAEGLLRAMAAAPNARDALVGSPLTFEALDAWPASVDGAVLLNELAQTYERYLILPAGGADTLALWTLYTYLYDAFDISPNLTLTSPQKRCGKSTVLTVASALVSRPLLTSNISPASLFRVVEQCAPTLLVDETDTFAREDDALRGILNSGHTRRTAYVIRTVGDDHEPRKFSTWCPKMLAGIGNLPDTIRDRSIILHMARKKPSEQVKKWREQHAETLAPLRQRCARWAGDSRAQCAHSVPDVPDTLNDRAADNWRTLLAIAQACGGAWIQRATAALHAITGVSAEEDESVSILLLEDLAALFVRHEKLSTEMILTELTALDERPWPAWGKSRKPLTARDLSTLLRPFGIRSKSVRMGDGSTPKGYDRESFDESFSRYLPSQAATPPQSNNDATKHSFSSATPPANVADEKLRKPSPILDCGGVADQQGGGEEKNEGDAYDEGAI